jgi:hypothetical protein
MNEAFDESAPMHGPRPGRLAPLRALRVTAAAMMIGGIATIIGSFSTWGACPLAPCGSDFGLSVIREQSGVQFGPGLVTAVLGGLLTILGVIGTRKVDRLIPLLGFFAGVGALTTVALHLVMVYGGAQDIVIGTPYAGLYITVIGALTGLAASLRARNVRSSQLPPARPARGQVPGRGATRPPDP